MSNPIKTLFLLAKQEKISCSEIGRRVDLSRSRVTHLKNDAEDMSLMNFIKIADSIGYEVVLMDKANGRVVEL